MKSIHSSPTITSLDASNIICLHSVRVKLVRTPLLWGNLKGKQAVTPHLERVRVAMWCIAQTSEASALSYVIFSWVPLSLFSIQKSNCVLTDLLLWSVLARFLWSMSWHLFLSVSCLLMTINCGHCRDSSSLSPSHPKARKIGFCHLYRSQLVPRPVGLS